jgi:Skp family chaperone for outer membrane proteins
VSMSHRLAVGLAAVGLVACSVTLSYAQGTVTGNRPAGGAGTAGTRPVGAGAGAGAGAVAPASATSMSSGSRTAGTSVVVIDIGEVFKQHAQFNKQLTGLKDEMKNLESYYQGEQRRVAQKRDELSTFNPGSAQYKKLEEEAARMVSDLQVEMALKQKNIAEAEAKLYYTTYTEITQHVAEFAERYGISLVLRHNNVQMDPQKRDTVMQGVNRAIVYQQKLDITDEIAKRVNAGATVKSAPAAAAPAVRNAANVNGTTSR